VSQERWDLVITPKRGWLDIDLAGLWRYRDLVVLLFWRDFVSVYKQTILGPLWFLIQPLLQTAAYFVVFGKIARISTGAIPPLIFFYSGVVFWAYFAACFTKTSETFTANAHIFGKVYFPRLVVPVASCISNLAGFVTQIALLVAMIVWFSAQGAGVSLGVQALLAIPLTAYVAVLAMGAGSIISALTTRYRDLTYMLAAGLQLWMFATPVVYPLREIPEKWYWLFLFNPMAAPVESFRAAMFGTLWPPPQLWLASAVETTLLVLLGLVLFSRAERHSMDTV
jgi:lipopolysaccharide transport system permease protein